MVEYIYMPNYIQHWATVIQQPQTITADVYGFAYVSSHHEKTLLHTL